MQCQHKGYAERLDEVDDVRARSAAEDAELVLDHDHFMVTRVQFVRSVDVARAIVMSDGAAMTRDLRANRHDHDIEPRAGE